MDNRLMNNSKKSIEDFEYSIDEARLDQINRIRESRSRERNKLDNILLIIAAGTLSLSATFVSQSARIFVEKQYLFASWVFLIIGLLSILFGYIFADLHFKYFEDGIKKDLFKSFDDAENNLWNKLVNVFNWASFIAIVIGVNIFVYFAYLNISD